MSPTCLGPQKKSCRLLISGCIKFQIPRRRLQPQGANKKQTKISNLSKQFTTNMGPTTTKESPSPLPLERKFASTDPFDLNQSHGQLKLHQNSQTLTHSRVGKHVHVYILRQPDQPGFPNLRLMHPVKIGSELSEGNRDQSIMLADID